MGLETIRFAGVKCRNLYLLVCSGVMLCHMSGARLGEILKAWLDWLTIPTQRET